jgi:U3 small nucleolar RNA-associated protein 4
MSVADERSALVHRVRFVEYKPQGIVALTFNAKGHLLAVGRSNGDIEIWSVLGTWFCTKRIPGSGENIVRRLFWVPDALDDENERLFSVGLNGRVIEWDLTALIPKHAADSHGGAVWDAALNPTKTHLACGCEDGSVRVFDIRDTAQAPVYERALMQHNARVLSVCWPTGNRIVTGGGDSAIRKWSVGSGTCDAVMGVETIAHEETAVWAVACLQDGTVISGDSLGHIQVWDGVADTLETTFSKHKADVLSIVCCEDESGTVVYASGIDNTITEMRRLPDTLQFVLTTFQRPHTHDVHAMALSPLKKRLVQSSKRKRTGHQGKDVKYKTDRTLVSGGNDTQLCVFLCSEFRKRAIKIPPFYHGSMVCVSASEKVPRPRFMVAQGQKIDLYELGEPAQGAEQVVKANTEAKNAAKMWHNADVRVGKSYSHLLTINVNAKSAASNGSDSEEDGEGDRKVVRVRGGLNITCTALSPDSSMIAGTCGALCVYECVCVWLCVRQ